MRDIARQFFDRLHVGEIAVFALPLVLLPSFSKRMIDYGIFRALGEQMVRTRTIGDVEVISHTMAGETFLHGSWLSPLVFVAWDRMGGMAGTFILHAVVVAAGIGLAYLYAKQRSGRIAAAALAVLVGAALFGDNLMLRPQTLIMPLFVAAHWIAADRRDRWWAVPAMALISVVWTNLHGSFVLLIPLLGAIAADPLLARDVRGTLQAGALLFVAAAFTVVNPYGFALWGFVLENMTAAQSGMTEWAAPRFGSLWFWRLPIFAALCVMLFLRKPRPRWSDVLLLAGLLFASFRTLRMAMWLGLVAIPILAPRIAQRLPAEVEPKARTRRLHRVVSVALMLLALLSWVRLPRDGSLDHYVDPDTPVALYEAVRAERPGGAKLWNPQEWGSTLAWLLGPEWPVFIDIRAWVFTGEVWDQYAHVARADPGWRGILASHEVDAVLVQVPRMAELESALTLDPGWREAHREPRGVLYLRADSEKEAPGVQAGAPNSGLMHPLDLPSEALETEPDADETSGEPAEPDEPTGELAETPEDDDE